MSDIEILKDEKNEGGHTIESHPDLSDNLPPTPSAEEAKSILDGRAAAFNVDLRPILKKHSFALSAEPVIVDGKILARPTLTDMLGKEEEKA